MNRAVFRMAGALLVGLGVATLSPGPLRAAPQDYPTEALADYVFACMASNGQTQDTLRRCSCSIDRIADQLSYDEYVQAETVLSMRQARSGERFVMFRTSPWAQAIVDKLREAQVEAELVCF